MNSASNRLSSLGIGAALLGAAMSSQAAVGARVLLQEWSPLTPKQQSVRVLASDASVVSDAVQKAWTEARPRICAQLLGAMGKGGAAAGQTLYDIKCLLDESPAFSIASAGANALSAELALGGYVEATSTTPTALGSYANPRFSLALKAKLLLTMPVQANPDQTLRIDTAKFSLADATLDSHNFTGDVLKMVVDDLIPYFHGPNYKQLVEGAIDGVSVDTAGRFNTALGPVNARLRGPSGAVRVGIWGKPDAIVVAFGPRELVPPTGGAMFGALRWDASKIIAPSGCDSFSIAATVQTGPAPLRDPGGYFEPGDAPTRKLGTFQLQAGNMAGECRYRLSGLAAAWPNEVLARSAIGAGKTAGNSLYRTNFVLAGDGWDGRTVLPQPSAERNYRVSGSVSGEATVDAGAVARRKLLNPADPVINPADRVGAGVITQTARNAALMNLGKAAAPAGALNPTTPLLSKSSHFSAPSSFGNGAALNPQPLPPGPPEARSVK